MRYVETEGLNFAFIPAYSSECAPIEKKNFLCCKEMLSEGKGERINFLTPRSMSYVSNEVVKNLWWNLMNESLCIIKQIGDIV